jgi:hypothetical protein
MRHISGARKNGGDGADDESGEAQRIAGELVKLHRDGAFADASDLEARFYAQVFTCLAAPTQQTARTKKKRPLPLALAHASQPRSKALSCHPD